MAPNQKNIEEDLQYFRDMGVKFEKFLRVPTFPIAIKLIRSKEEIPNGSKRPVKDLGFKTAVCQNFRQVRAYGWTIALVGKRTHGAVLQIGHTDGTGMATLPHKIPLLNPKGWKLLCTPRILTQPRKQKHIPTVLEGNSLVWLFPHYQERK
jgi:hypothetical protein